VHSVASQGYPGLTGRALFTAGDDFGASPPISRQFDEVPAILGQRLMGIDVGTFGNHNFDKGVGHLQEMIDLAGSTDPADVGDPFSYVSANLENRDDELGSSGRLMVSA